MQLGRGVELHGDSDRVNDGQCSVILRSQAAREHLQGLQTAGEGTLVQVGAVHEHSRTLQQCKVRHSYR